jgi:hypothetical protein
MKVSYEKPVRHSLKVDEDSLLSLCKFISDRYERFNFSAHCNDGTRLNELQIEQLIAYPNPSDRKIESISLSARTGTSDELTLDIWGGSPLRSARLCISAESTDTIVLVSQTILNVLKDMKPWYDWLARIRWNWILNVFYFVWALWAAVLLLAQFSGGKSTQTPLTLEYSPSSRYLCLPSSL